MLYEVLLQYTFASQVMQNRWNYQSSGTPAAVSRSFALAAAFGSIYNDIAMAYPTGTILNNIAGAVSTAVTYDFIMVKALYDNLDFYELPFVQPYTGLQTGDAMAPFVAVGFRTSRVNLAIKRGTKRFSGVPESLVVSGGAVSATYRDDYLLPLAESMGEVLEYDDEGNTLSFTPVVLQREKRQVPDSDPARYAYYLYPTLEEQEDHLAAGFLWEPYDNVRSQATRQRGRGI